MAGDSSAVGGHFVSKVTRPKVFKSHGFVYGYAGSFRVGQVMEHAFVPPKIPETVGVTQDSFMKYMVTDYVKSLKRCLKENGCIVEVSNTSCDDEEDFFGAAIMIGYGGRLFEIESGFHVAEYTVPYMSIGVGRDFSLGSLYSTTDRTDLKPKEKLTMALDAACEFSGWVSKPYHFVNT